MKKEKIKCPYKLITIIINSLYAEKVELFLHKLNKQNSLIFMGKGTAKSTFEDIFSFGIEDRYIFHLFAENQNVLEILSKLKKRFTKPNIEMGMAFSTPIDAMSSNLLLNLTEKESNMSKNIENLESPIILNQNEKYELIISVINRGYADYVVEAARSVGATGATILFGRGSYQKDDTVFGISIHPEKETVLILSPIGQKMKIMKEIVEQTSIPEKGNAICFSIPVNDACLFANNKKKSKK